MMLRFRKSSGQMTSKKKFRNLLYLIFAIIMGLCGILLVFKSILKWPGFTTIILEIMAQLSFGISWLIKSGKFEVLND